MVVPVHRLVNMTKQQIVGVQARQGDVLIIPAAMPPIVTLTEVPVEGGKVVVAHGEATGHHHAFSRRAVTMYRDESDARFVRVEGTARPGDVERAAELNAEIGRLFDRVEVPVETRKAEVEALAVTAEADGFAALRHLGGDGRQADHKPVIVPAGFTGRVLVPSEYTPAAIVPVQD